MKRYAIVRVDDKSDNNCKNCEMLYTNANGNNDCRLRIGASFLCDRYGDTKEQMVLKVSQALKMAYEERTGNYGYSLKFYEPMAKFIVEFLGVK